MKKVTLKKLVLENFKGIKNLSIDFEDSQESSIHGRNGLGKTTIADAYFWLLYGKNSQNQSDFGLKTKDENNKVINFLENVVEGTFEIDESIVTLKRLNREKWVKKKGNEISELKGNETIFFINDVPKTLSEYKQFVDSIIKEEIQKILSNPNYFNSSMKWNERRVVLSSIIGDINVEDITSKIPVENIEILNQMLNSEKTLEDYKKEYAVKKKKIKDELDLVPARIDEANRGLLPVKDWALITSNIEAYKLELSSIDEKILNKNHSVDLLHIEITKTKNLKFNKQQELTELINTQSLESKEKLNSFKLKKSNYDHSIGLNQNLINQNNEKVQLLLKKIENSNLQINKLESERKDLLLKFNAEAEVDFEYKGETSCHTCLRELESSSIDENKVKAKLLFEKKQSDYLTEIKVNGKSKNSDKEIFAKSIEVDNTTISELKLKNTSVSLIIDKDKKSLSEILIDISNLENLKVEKTEKEIEIELEITSIVIPEIEPVDIADLKILKSETQIKIDASSVELHTKFQIETQLKRIQELIKTQKDISQEIASFEKVEMIIDCYNKLKIEEIERKVNSKFSLVKFKMFNTLMNGGSEECCIATYNGVEWNDLNTASRINCGLDIINALSEFYELKVPIMLDGRESISQIIKIDSQVINLIVDPKCEVLTIK